MPAYDDPEPSHDDGLPASFYFIEGEDAAREGKKRTDCRYIEGAIAWSEWMAGYEAGTLDLSAFDPLNAPLTLVWRREPGY